MQYKGNAQHDAQEFLLWLLDRVHEDLNNHPNNRPSIKVNFCLRIIELGPTNATSGTVVVARLAQRDS